MEFNFEDHDEYGELTTGIYCSNCGGRIGYDCEYCEEDYCDPDWLREARMPKTGIRNLDDEPD